MRNSPARAALRALGMFLIASTLIAESPARAQERLSVVTSTNDLRSLAEAVGGERTAVTALVPPGFDPEEYQPRPQDLTRVRRAQAVVRVGLDFDLWLDRLLAQSGASVRRGADGYVDASLGIATLDVRGMSIGDAHGHGSGNPHYWLDPRNAEIITADILAALVGIDPGSSAIYEANRRTFLSRLEPKIKEWEDRLAALRGVPLVAYHNSWPYFARRFRLEFIGTVEPKPGVPPSPAHLASLISTMNARGARIIVRQPHEPEKDVGFVAKRTGSVVAVLASSVGALPGTDDYSSLFDVNVAALRAAAGVQ
jgi:ABC-type Zn uptake system ZnuABC Zn-binding protein ZnuA